MCLEKGRERCSCVSNPLRMANGPVLLSARQVGTNVHVCMPIDIRCRIICMCNYKIEIEN